MKPQNNKTQKTCPVGFSESCTHTVYLMAQKMAHYGNDCRNDALFLYTSFTLQLVASQKCLIGLRKLQ